MSYVSNIKVFGKFLDQPKLIHQLNSISSKALIGGAIGYGLYDTSKVPENQKTKRFIKNVLVLSLTIGSALMCLKGLKINGHRIFHGILSGHHPHHHGEKTIDLIKKFFTKNGNQLDDLTKNLLEKTQSKILSLSEVKKLYSSVLKFPDGKALLDRLIPDPHAHGYKEIIKEIKNLSLLGLIPVIGGISGGVIGDMLTEKDWKPQIKNKLKEGFYQYLANIFLCNVGAGLSLFAMDKIGIKSKPVKLAGMLGGIVITGIIFGSAIANYISLRVINPICEKGFTQAAKDLLSGKTKNKETITLKNINKERHPEFLDAILHLDDVATAGFLAGFKWIESVLPVFYTISAYRAGMGYRNGHSHFKRSSQEKHQNLNSNFFNNYQKGQSINHHHWKNFEPNRPFKVFEEFSKTGSV